MDLSFFIRITMKMSPTQSTGPFFFFFNTCEVFLKNLFISCTGFSLVAASGGYPVVVMYGLIAVASLVAEHRLQGMWASVAVAGGLSSCSSQALEHRLNSCSTQA